MRVVVALTRIRIYEGVIHGLVYQDRQNPPVDVDKQFYEDHHAEKHFVYQADVVDSSM